mgnify:CR=1 FL=1
MCGCGTVLGVVCVGGMVGGVVCARGMVLGVVCVRAAWFLGWGVCARFGSGGVVFGWWGVGGCV